MTDLTALAREIREINAANGWNVITDDDWDEVPYKVPAIIALIHSEASEALEAYRANDRKNFEEEMADVVIRVLDCVGGFPDMNIDRAIREKLEQNRRRGHRHGGKRV